MGIFLDSDAEIKVTDGVLKTRQVLDHWTYGPDEYVHTLAELLIYLDALSPPLTVYNVMPIGNVTETQNYATTNTALTEINIYSPNGNYNDFGAYSPLDFTNCAQYVQINCVGVMLKWNYAISKVVVTVPTGFGANMYLDCRLENYSPDGVITPFSTSTNVRINTGINFSLFVNVCGQGGIYGAAMNGPATFEGGASTVEDIYSSNAVCEFTPLNLVGTFSDGSAFTNPLMTTDKLSITGANLQTTADVFFDCQNANIVGLRAENSSGSFMIKAQDELTMSGCDLGTDGAILLDTVSVYNLSSITADRLQLDSGFTGCELKVASSKFTGTDENVIGKDFYSAYTGDLLTFGTGENDLFSLTTSAATFANAGAFGVLDQMSMIFEFFLNSAVDPAANNTYRFKVNGTTYYTFVSAPATNINIQFRYTLYRFGTGLRAIIWVLQDGVVPVIKNVDISEDPLAPATVLFTAEGSSGGNVTTVSLYTITHN